MKKTEKNKTLSKTPKTVVKWPINKFINKFFIYNLVLVIGIIMLILSLVKQDMWDESKLIGNVVASSLTLFAGFAGGLIYSLLMTFKGEVPLEKKFSTLTKWFFWVPILDIVFDKIWKSKENKKAYAIKRRENPDFKKPKKFLPNAVSLIFVAMVGMVFLIWILYLAGVLVPDASKGETIPGILDIFLNPLRGFAGYKQYQGPETGKVLVAGVGSLVIFLFMFNAAMTLVNDSRSIEAGIGALLRKMKGKEVILIPTLMLILGICGSTFNMCEQLLPIMLIIIPIMFAAGYDTMTGFLMVNMSAGVGVMASTVNPVLIGTAVNSIDPTWVEENNFAIMTGITWRLVLFAALMVTVILCTILYARKVKKNPQKSCVYMSEKDFKKMYSFDKNALPPMTTKRKWSLIVFGIAFLMLIIGFIDWQTIAGFNGFQIAHDWLMTNLPFLTTIDPIGKFGMIEAGMLFFIAALIIGAINWKGAGHFFDTFYQGCRQFIGVAFIISVAKGLSITMTTSGINGMISGALGGVLSKMPAVGAMLMIFLVIAILTVFIPSSSGLASAMFPTISNSVITATAQGAATISMSGAVTTFASAMGWVNLFTPTGMVMPFCEISKVEYAGFVKASWKHCLILLIVGLGLMAVGCYLPGLY